MEANELRIGNTITHQNNNGIYLVTVLETLKNGVNVKTNLQLGEWFLRYEEVQGTPLTEEWLLKFGFKRNLLDSHNPEEGYYFSLKISDDRYCDLYFITGDKNGFTEVCLFPYEERFRYRYVHQIHNLYFGLTGEELEVTI
ncbi:hypothetical protein [Sphingobacterium mizutaii]|uniref:hypothetical protein n=1 Tax=Sphingobacterium mizutaii TaxID=1010 RepID=UPI0028A11E85|nr:hypothetical protein [Sphingobacterium mizutaii]